MSLVWPRNGEPRGKQQVMCRSCQSAAGVILLTVEVRLKRGVVSEEELKAAALSCQKKRPQEVCTPPLHAFMHTPSTVAKSLS